jgi:hypothetical protein
MSSSLINTLSRCLPNRQQAIQQIQELGSDLAYTPPTERPEAKETRLRALKDYVFGIAGTLDGLRRILSTVEEFARWVNSTDILSRIEAAMEFIRQIFKLK